MYRLSTAVAAVLATAAVGTSGVAGAAAVVGAADHFFPTSGSTALDNSIKEYFLLSGGICQAGSVTAYVDGASDIKTGVHQTLVVCKSSAGFGNVASGDVIGLAKESNGGSLEGTINVARGQTLNFLDALATGGISCGGSHTVAAGADYGHQQAYTLNTSCSTLKAYAPVLGWADEVPATWLGFGDRPITNGDISGLASDPLVQNAFGIAVSLNLYRALQTQQGLSTSSDNLANMPSLSTSVISGIYTGAIGDWSQVTNAAGSSAASGTVYICRRGDSSGTNAFVDLQFLNNRCSSSSATQVTPSTADNSSACKGLPAGLNAHDFGCAWQSSNLGDVVFPGTGGGDVAACLDAHSHAGQFAIGNLTTNQAFGDAGAAGGTGDASTGSTTHFRFVSIDGRKPNLTSVANGQYPFMEDNVLNKRTNASTTVSGLESYISSSTTGFSSVTIVRDTIAAQPAAGDADWISGVLFDALNTDGVSQNTTPVTTANLTTTSGRPVSAYTQLLGGSPNNCQPPIAVGGTINK